MKRRRLLEGTARFLFLAAAATSIVSVLFITVFVVSEGVPLFFGSVGGYDPPGVFEFLFGADWFPTERPPEYGILPFIVASFAVTLGALIIAVPIGIAVGVFIAEIARGRAQRLIRGGVELLSGIPSVIYGFFGVITIGFFLQRFKDPLLNYNMFTAMVILAIMTLPTIINVTEVSIRSVPREYPEGALALGATQSQTIVGVIIPSARSGIITGVILGMGRAIGETLAVLMVAGNQPTLPMDGLKSRVRTLTMALVNDMGYAGGDHRVALFTIAIVLFIFILIINLTTRIITQRAATRAERYEEAKRT